MAAETYPWGNKTPAQRIAGLESQIKANDKKRSDLVEAHRQAIAKIDETDKQLKSDLRSATAIAERERRDAMAAAAARLLDRVMGGATNEALEAAIKSGDFEKALAKAVEEATTGGKRKTPTPAPMPAPTPAPTPAPAPSSAPKDGQAGGEAEQE